jgi:hypothetical protein
MKLSMIKRVKRVFKLPLINQKRDNTNPAIHYKKNVKNKITVKKDYNTIISCGVQDKIKE